MCTLLTGFQAFAIKPLYSNAWRLLVCTASSQVRLSSILVMSDVACPRCKLSSLPLLHAGAEAGGDCWRLQPLAEQKRGGGLAA